MKKVKIIKIAAVEEARVPTPEFNNFVQGVDNNGVSLPIDYTVEGYLQNDIEVGKPVLMLRTKRNDVECQGLFTTSEVRELTSYGFNTLNSKYTIETLSEY